MYYVFVHGLGQNSSSWNKTISFMDKKNIVCPNLVTLNKNNEATYENLYKSFVEYCNNYSEPINLCGLSLGGILALNFAIDYPQKTNSLVLIGTPYKIPKILFGIQSIIFRIIPKFVFIKIGWNKKDILKLIKSMKELNFSTGLKNILCSTLIICGQKDRLNMKSSKYLTKNIKNANIKIIENTGHVINTENPEKLAFELEKYYD
jgi:pimeloyl-ACP methyl ester carboxylesterase